MPCGPTVPLQQVFPSSPHVVDAGLVASLAGAPGLYKPTRRGQGTHESCPFAGALLGFVLGFFRDSGMKVQRSYHSWWHLRC